MTFRVFKSHIVQEPDFEARVECYRQARLDHHKTVDVPAPTEHHLIEACVRRVPREGDADDWVTDYEIIDDTPSPPTLAERKIHLMNAVNKEEGAAYDAIVPLGKRRLFSHRASDIMKKDENARSPEEVQFLVDRKADGLRVEKITRHAAELLAEIEDLTEETIGTWQMKPFPT